MTDKRFYKCVNGKLITIPPMDELCEMLKEKFAEQALTNELLKEENEKLKSNVWADETMADLKNKYEVMWRAYYDGFPISIEEKKVLLEWIRSHEEDKHNGELYSGAVGGAYTYKFTPTSIGTIGEIECNCGEKFCFRELD
jgi:hypothetical protein